MSLAVGDSAPDFDMPASLGRTASLQAQLGRPVVLYFYPKADTSGCTAEAQAFQQALPQFTELGVTVVGVSRDPIKAIDKFAAKYDLQFPLASDAGAVSEAYGVWVEKSMYGKKYMGLERATFLIGKDGKIARVWPKVKVPGHAAEVLAAVRAL